MINDLDSLSDDELIDGTIILLMEIRLRHQLPKFGERITDLQLEAEGEKVLRDMLDGI